MAVQGVPMGTSPTVVVRGPRRYKREVLRGGTTLTRLRPGRYRISVRPVRIRRARRSGTRFDVLLPARRIISAKVGAGRITKVTVAFPVIKDSAVRPFGARVLSRFGRAESPMALRVRTRSAPRSGAILVSGPRPGLEFGLLHRVAAVTGVGNTRLLRLEPVPLGVAFPRLVVKRDLALRPASETRARSAALADSISFVASAGPVSCGVPARGWSIRAPLTLRPSLDVALNPTDSRSSGHLILRGAGSLSITATVPSGVRCSATIPGPVLVGVIVVGHIPIPVYGTVKAKLSASLTSSATIRASAPFRFSGGMRWQAGRTTPTQELVMTPTGSVSPVQSQLRLVPTLEVGIGHPSAGAHVSAGAGLELASDSCGWDLGPLLEAAAGVSLGSLSLEQPFFSRRWAGVTERWCQSSPSVPTSRPENAQPQCVAPLPSDPPDPAAISAPTAVPSWVGIRAPRMCFGHEQIDVRWVTVASDGATWLRLNALGSGWGPDLTVPWSNTATRALVRLDASGAQKFWPEPRTESNLASDLAGNVWYGADNSLVRRNANGDTQQYSVAPSGYYVRSVITRPDGSTWFLASAVQSEPVPAAEPVPGAFVGRIRADGDFARWPISLWQVDEMVEGPDGAFWAIQTCHFDACSTPGAAIVRISTNGQYSRVIMVPGTPTKLTVGGDDALWWVDREHRGLSRYTLNGTLVNHLGPWGWAEGPLIRSPTGVTSIGFSEDEASYGHFHQFDVGPDGSYVLTRLATTSLVPYSAARTASGSLLIGLRTCPVLMRAQAQVPATSVGPYKCPVALRGSGLP